MYSYIHVDWVFSEPEGRVAGCPVLSLGLQESLLKDHGV